MYRMKTSFNFLHTYPDLYKFISIVRVKLDGINRGSEIREKNILKFDLVFNPPIGRYLVSNLF